MRKALIYISTIVLFLCQNIWSQDMQGLIKVTTNMGSQVVNVKWIPREVIHASGFNLYRKSVNAQWQKLHVAPIKPDVNYALEQMSSDEQNFYRKIAATKDNQELEGILKLAVITQACLYDEYAFMLGLRYDDTQVELGQRYKYKVAAITKNGEDELGESDWITAGEHVPIKPPDSLQMIYVNEDEVTFRWEPETDRYFGINAYRTDLAGSKREKINDKPIIIARSYNELGMLTWPEYFFIDTNLVKDQTYRYEFTAIDVFGEEGPSTNPLDVFVPDTKAPRKITKSQASGAGDGKHIDLTWKPSTSKDVAGYSIHRSKNSKGGFEKVHDGLIVESNYRDKLERPGDYFYHIYAEDATGNKSRSALILGELLDIHPPEGTKNVKASIRDGLVTIEWSAVNTWDLYGYRILRAHGADPEHKDFTPVEESFLRETSFVDDITHGTEAIYTYGVMTVDSFNLESDIIRSNTIVVEDITAPTAPTIVDATPGIDHINIAWLPSPNADVVGYHLYRSAWRDTSHWTLLNQTIMPSDMRSFEDQNKTDPFDYFYKMEAIDDHGLASKASNYFHLEIVEDYKDLATLKINVRYKKSDAEVEIRWKNSAEQSTRGFVIYRREDEAPWLPVSGLIQANKFADARIEKGKNYQYQVRKYDTEGLVIKSNMAEILIDSEN